MIVEADAVVHPWTVMVHPEHAPAFQATILKPNSVYRHNILYLMYGSGSGCDMNRFMRALSRLVRDGNSQLAYVAMVGQRRLCPLAGLAEARIHACSQMVAL